MRIVLWSCLLGTTLFFPLGCRRNDSASANGSFAERIQAARLIGDPGKRDDAYAKLAQDAADSSDVEITKESLRLIGDPKVRDSASAASARSLANHGKREGAVRVAQTIGDPKIRDEALAQIARADVGN
jgi:hypothetical protein